MFSHRRRCWIASVLASEPSRSPSRRTGLHLWPLTPLPFGWSHRWITKLYHTQVSGLPDFPCSSLWSTTRKKWLTSVHFLYFLHPDYSKRRRKKGYFSNEALWGINVSARLQNCAQQKLCLLWKILIASAAFETFHFKMWGNWGYLPEWALTRR